MQIPSLKAARQAVLAAITLSLPLWVVAAETASPSADAQPAVWAPQELHFVYLGFTARYSCDGLRDKIRHVLGELGARAGFEVDYSGCSSPFGKPDPFPGVRIRMHVLQPAGAHEQSAEVIAAHWRRVDLRLNRDPVWEATDCELLEQVRQKILPLFTTRNVDFGSNCVPHQAYLGTHLSADLLIPDAKGDKAPAAK